MCRVKAPHDELATGRVLTQHASVRLEACTRADKCGQLAMHEVAAALAASTNLDES